MKVFQTKQTLQEKMQQVKNIVLNHICHLHHERHPLSMQALSNLHLILNHFLLKEIVCEIEKSERVMLFLEIGKISEGNLRIEAKVRSLGESNWDEYLEGDIPTGNGLCINFVFNGDYANSLYYIVYEDQLRHC